MINIVFAHDMNHLRYPISAFDFLFKDVYANIFEWASYIPNVPEKGQHIKFQSNGWRDSAFHP